MADEPTNTNQPTTNAVTTTQIADGGITADKLATPPTWDEWHGGLSADHKALIDTHVAGLKETVKATRSERDDLAKQIKALASKADKGSELETQLAQLQTQLTTQTQRADFIEAAPSKGVTNIAAAWKLAQADGLIGKSGETDWDTLKTTYPELFAKAEPPKAPDINSGSRTTVTGKSKQELIDSKRRSYGGI